MKFRTHILLGTLPNILLVVTVIAALTGHHVLALITMLASLFALAIITMELKAQESQKAQTDETVDSSSGIDHHDHDVPLPSASALSLPLPAYQSYNLSTSDTPKASLSSSGWFHTKAHKHNEQIQTN